MRIEISRVANGGPALTGALERFKSRLADLENPGEDRLPIVTALQEAFAVMSSRDPVEDRKIRARTYLRLLDDLPVWSAVRAIEAFMRGDAGDGRWLPTPGEIIREARRLSSDFDREAAELRQAIGLLEAGTIEIVTEYPRDDDD
jgi:hypothetical protein